MKVKLTLKTIIRWEQLRKKSFSLMDYSDKDDMESLLYTATICNNKEEICTFEVFRQTLVNEKVAREIVAALGQYMGILAQFQAKHEADISTTEGNPDLISNIVSTLIMLGLDASYVLNDMELCDLPMYIEAYERQKKERMEESRMWTYFTMLPHIDAKKMKNGARDLIIFPWEEQEIQREAERALREDADRFEEFMKQGRNFKS